MPNKGCLNSSEYIWFKGISIKIYNAYKPYNELINNIDVIVDGKFEIEKKNPSLKFRGSENQRLIDVKKSLSRGQIIWADVEDEEIRKAN